MSKIKMSGKLAALMTGLMMIGLAVLPGMGISTARAKKSVEERRDQGGHPLDLNQAGSRQSTFREKSSSVPTSLSAYLNPDGTLRPGQTGAFRTAGYRMTLTPAGAPRFVASSCLGWDSQFGLVNGPNSEVFAIAVSGNSLYVGGSFIAVGQLPANRLARYDLLTGVWSQVGSNGGNGVDEIVTSLAVVGGHLYVGGFFTSANVGATPVAANRIARFEMATGTWSPLGTGGGNGVDDLVFDLAVIGSNLYLGGTFTTANFSAVAGAGNPGIPARSLARYNPQSGEWSAIGVGGGNGVDGVVLVLAGSGTDLYVGGRFLTANVGGPVVSASNVVRFSTTESVWRPLGTGEANGVDDEVRAFAQLDGNLYVGGRFRMAGTGPAGVVANYLARYNPATNLWSGLGSGGGNGVNADVYSLAVLGGELIAGGDFTSANVGANSVAANRLVRFNPVTAVWGTVGAGTSGKSLAGSVYRIFSTGSDLILGGNFALANSSSPTIFANNLVRYRESTGSWETLINSTGNGANSEIYAMARIGQQVFFGGRFTSIGGIAANYIARYDLVSGAWSQLGTGGGNGVNEVVLDMTVIGTDLYVGGGFTAANIGGLAIPVGYVARYDTLTGDWSALGTGPGAGVNDSVYALTSIGTTLFVGGGFSSAGSAGAPVSVNRLARYETGSRTWSAVGSGTGNGANEFVFTLAALGADLYLGGIFTAVNEGGATVTANRLARYNTTTGAWSPLGTGAGNGVDEVVISLAVLGSDLYVGGIFSTVNAGGAEVPARNIARYNTVSSTWSSLGAGGGNGVEDRGVSALTVLDSDLYVGGYFTSVNVGGPLVLARRVAKYSPLTNTWSSLLDFGGGNGLDYNVYTLLGVDNSLFVGGGFSTAGDNRISTNIARYCPNSAPTIAGAIRTISQGSSALRMQIATVADSDQPAASLNATAIIESGVGIDLSAITIDENGNVSALIQSSCTATTSTFTVSVIDSFNVKRTAVFTLNVTPNSAPTLAYAAQTVGLGGTVTVGPLRPPADNGRVASLTVQSQGSLSGVVAVGADGSVSIANAGPVGQHVITIRATDDCGQTTEAMLPVTVTASALQLTALEPERMIVGTGGAALTVTGRGFSAGAIIRINGEPRPTTVLDAARLTAALTPADIASPRVLTVTVIDPLGVASNSLSLPVYARVTSTTATGYASGEIAPDSIAAAFGPQLAKGVELSTALPLPNTLLGTRITVRDSAGVVRDQPLFFVAPQQVNYLLHKETAGGAATVTVYIDNTIVALGEIQVVRTSPGLFTQNSTGEGVPAAYALRVAGGNVTGVPIMTYDQAQAAWVPVPIDLGPVGDEIYLVLFGSGMRGATGISGITARLGDKAIPVLYLGADSTYVGLDQLNLGPVPKSLVGAGIVNLTVSVDGQVVNAGKAIRLQVK